MIIPDFTSERDLFRWIWDNRPHYSEVSGKRLGEELNVWTMAHCLPKGSYRLFKFKIFNIILMTPREHTLYDQETHIARSMPEFNWVFEYRAHLTRKYHALPNIKLYGC